ncbi:MAG TPA: hypothetical protein VFM46_05285 [Pseudomonadales bacterium]|nr:hypothetical protein [Pseudomonadales bacterium]
MITSTLKTGLIVSAIALLTACGGGGSKEEYPTGDRYKNERPGLADPSTATTQSAGVFLDSPVAGLNYKTSTGTGQTDANGKFFYSSADKVEFYYGSISFGSASPQALLTPLDLTADANTLINQLRLLQTLDADGDASNGILLPDAGLVPENISINFAQSPEDFSKDPNVLALLAATTNVSVLVTAEAAQDHFNQSLANYKSTAR